MIPSPVTAAQATRNRARFFYTGAAALLLLLTFLGFQQFYLHGRAYPSRPLAPPIRALVITHGVTMSLWVLLLLAQPILIVSRKHRVHMTMGWIGSALAAAIIVTGVWVAIAAVKAAPPETQLWDLPYRHFMAVPLCAIVLFAAFVGIGIWKRKRPAIHRPMMILATLTAVVAAMDRVDFLTAIYRNTIWGSIFGPFFGAVLVGGLLLLVHWALTRSFDRWFAAGYVVLILASAGIMKLATTQAWDQFATMLLR